MSSFDNAFTAALSGTVSNTIVYPLDVAKAQIQTSGSASSSSAAAKSNQDQREPSKDESILQCLIRIYKNEGLKGLYKGYGLTMGSGIIQTFSYWLIYTMLRKKYYKFVCKRYLKNELQKSKTKSALEHQVLLSAWEELLLNITSASLSNFVTTPITIVSTSQKTAPSKSLKNHVMDIYNKNKTVLDFYKGLKISLLLTCNPAITYTVFKKVQHLIIQSYSHARVSDSSKHDYSIDDTSVRLSPKINFMCGMVSKIVATLVTFPLILAKVNLQNPNAETPYNNIFDVLINFYKKFGIKGWYRGLMIQLLKNVLNQGVNSMVKGELGKLVLGLRRTLKHANC
ncbi:hypothetical protein ACO0QE_000202 [Hanseniaspora vineae]